MKIKLQSVMQGSADVMDCGHFIGSVSHSYSDISSKRGWWAYDRNGRRISEYPNQKRDMAVKEVAAQAAV